MAAEYTLKERGGKGSYRVDYALLIPNLKKNLRCIIEVKAPGKLSGSFLETAENQLLKYAFITSVPLAILTDGLRWRFYLPNTQDKHVCTLDVKKNSPEEVVSKLIRYLSFENTISNKAKDYAEHDLEEKVAKEEISEAWKELLASGKLINLLIKETKKISGNSPEKRYVEEFLKGQYVEKEEDPCKGKGKIKKLVKFLTPLIEEGIYTRKQLQEKAEKKFKNNVSPNTIDTQLWGSSKSSPKLNRFPYVTEVDSDTEAMRFTKEVPKTKNGNNEKNSHHFFLLGKKYTERTAISAYISIFEILANRDRNFLGSLAPQTAGRKNRWLSQNRNDMSVYDDAAELPGGWWLDKNVSNEDKSGRLKKACEVAEIPFGKPNGLKIKFPPRINKPRNRKK